jgi:signal transduction histidine kinase
VPPEALANATKHAQASRIDVSLVVSNGSLVLSIRDDGVGGADPARGSGLIGLTDRVESLGGSLRVQSRPGDGTHITAELPLELHGSSSSLPSVLGEAALAEQETVGLDEKTAAALLDITVTEPPR